MMTIITELVDNAFKFTLKNDQVFLSLLQKEKAIEIKIQHSNKHNFEIKEFEKERSFFKFFRQAICVIVFA